MIVSRARRYIFVHIPKTGGTAMTLALEARAAACDIVIGDTPKARKRRRRIEGVRTAGRLWKHSRLADIEGLVAREEFGGLFCFTLVRNPWDRAASYYHWLRVQRFDHPAVKLARRLDFGAFLTDPAIAASLRASCYADYMTDGAGVEHCDAWVRIEHLDEDLAPVEAHLGFGLRPLARVNPSDRAADYRRYYDDESAAWLGRLAAADIARFGYRF
ncbi:sulfotransferase family 2 domain-containing protein [Rhodovulum marinum]|uniref:Sulfotransferase family protein n=1 Tax=Rhodovulum marinum TaxID=320662 RepID=A0A4R2Q0U9_9RHOB|nr:sulfotransferase family 2 domain-containing protein [Rhodovulum marinum]TCP41294.1 sulfotransferase family protein [Rhodovulum marinum]